MSRPLHPALFRHLRLLQSSTTVGVCGVYRRAPTASRSVRTVYRWQRSLGPHLLAVPSVAVEGLGLLHAHVFVRGPSAEWLRCPFGVEASWVTPDFLSEVLYVHCLVPASLRARVEALFSAFSCAEFRVVWSGSGWQQLLADERVAIPLRDAVVSDASLLRRHPFVVPALFESWHHPNSLPVLWSRIAERLGPRVRLFLPRTKVHHVNGKGHVADAFRVLRDAGLLRQHVIRYHPLLAASVEIFLHAVMDRAAVTAMVESLRASLHAVEAYPTESGYWCRLLGPHTLLDAVMQLAEDVRSRCGLVFFHTKRSQSPLVRFRYEELFDPATGEWTVPSWT